jgi:hypothetical protein
MAMGIYCNITTAHIAVDVIYKSVTFSKNNNNTGDNNKTSTFVKGFPESFNAAARHVRSLALSIRSAISAIFD